MKRRSESRRPWRSRARRAIAGSRATCLCNLGMHYIIDGRLDEAASGIAGCPRRWRASSATSGCECIVLMQPRHRARAPGHAGRGARRSSKPQCAWHMHSAIRAEGQFLGYLGLLHARQGRHEDARRCLDSGEALLRSASDRWAGSAADQPRRGSPSGRRCRGCEGIACGRDGHRSRGRRRADVGDRVWPWHVSVRWLSRFELKEPASEESGCPKAAGREDPLVAAKRTSVDGRFAT